MNTHDAHRILKASKHLMLARVELNRLSPDGRGVLDKFLGDPLDPSIDDILTKLGDRLGDIYTNWSRENKKE